MKCDEIRRLTPKFANISNVEENTSKVKIKTANVNNVSKYYDYSLDEDEDLLVNARLKHNEYLPRDGEDLFNWMKQRKKGEYIESIFVESRMEEILGDSLKSCKLPTKITDPIEFDPLPSEWFPPPNYLHQPMYMDISDQEGNTCTVQRIIGFREIFNKRQRQHLLYEEAKIQFRKTFREMKRQITMKNCEMKEAMSSRRTRTRVRTKISTPILNEILTLEGLVRGDGDGDGIQINLIDSSDEFCACSSSSDANSHVMCDLSFEDEVPVGGRGGHKKQRDDKRKSSKMIENKSSDKDTSSKKEKDKSDQGKEKEAQSKSIKANDPAKMTRAQRRKTLVDVETRERLLQEEIMEKDEEWFKLSESDEEQTNLKELTETMQKERPKWMKRDDISYESQMMIHETRWFTFAMAMFGRQPFSNVNPWPFAKYRHISFAMKPLIRQIPFIITSLLLWFITSNLMISMFLVYSTTGTTGQSIYDEFESKELSKYMNGFAVIVAQNLVVSIWSATVVYRDGEYICQYKTCLSQALNDMETSGIKGINKFIKINIFIVLLYAGVFIWCFEEGSPLFVKGTCRIVGLMTFRSYYPRLGFNKTFLKAAEYFGLVVIIFTTVCFRGLMAQMQINAEILGHAAEMWNFKFGLHFSQFAMMGRGHLYRLKLNSSLINMFKQHRFLYCLTKLYGAAYNIPMLMYFLLQTSVALLVMVALFFFQEDSLGENEEYKNDLGHSIGIKTHRAYNEFVEQGILVLIQTLGDFIYTTRSIAFAGNAIMDGFEFVRRQGQVVCTGSHERRLIQSLQWSLSGVNPALISTAFDVNPPTIFASLGAILMLYSLIIQIQSGSSGNILRTFACTDDPTKQCALLLKDRGSATRNNGSII